MAHAVPLTQLRSIKGILNKWHKIKVQVFEAKRQEEDIRAIVLKKGRFFASMSLGTRLKKC
jgi:hypothetical protein